MDYILLLCLSLSTVHGYKIKVQGKIQIGDQVAKVLTELQNILHGDGDANIIQNILESLAGGNAKISHKKYAVPGRILRPVVERDTLKEGIPFLDNYAQVTSAYENMKGGISLLEEMVRLKEDEAHIYGKHSNKEKRQYPLNNINV